MARREAALESLDDDHAAAATRTRVRGLGAVGICGLGLCRRHGEQFARSGDVVREIRSWALHHRSDKSLTELVQMYNPCIRGWITYYSHFYKTQLRPTLKRIDAYVIRLARRKFKRLRHQPRAQEIVLPPGAPAKQISLALAQLLAGDQLGDRMPQPERRRLKWPAEQVRVSHGLGERALHAAGFYSLVKGFPRCVNHAK